MMEKFIKTQRLLVVRTSEVEVRTKKDIRTSKERVIVPLSDLKPGAKIKISEYRDLEVIELNNETLEFMIGTRRYSLNRYWQVLGTVKFDIMATVMPSETERFTLLFETPVEKAEAGVYERMVELMNTIRKNVEPGDFCEPWRNIPLAREMMHLFKDATPLRDEEINPVVRMIGSGAVIDSYNLPVKDVPRLFLSFCEYWEVCRDLVEEADGEVKNEEKDARWYADQIFKYTWCIDQSMNADLYERFFAKDENLRVDILQFSPEWEKAIYDIELETAEALKDESRGMGFCYSYWSAKTAAAYKRKLPWRSPNKMNPTVRFD